jgi:hypothetical protein
MIIGALSMVALIGLMAVALDSSYGFIQNRRAQNASDFAAFAATQQLNNSSTCNGLNATPNMLEVVTLIQHIVDDNAPAVGSSWSAQFIDGTGQIISGSTFTPASGNSGTFPPFGACGVAVNAVPSWTPFLAGIFGTKQLNGNGNAKVTITGGGQPIGIVSLNEVGPHAILGGGTGKFVVSGDIFLNTNVQNQPWTANYNNAWEFDDAIDAKTSSNLSVYGTIKTNNGTYHGEPLWPLDACFVGTGPVGQGTNGPGDPTGGPGPPLFNPPCSEGNVSVAYNHIDPNFAAISDPLRTASSPPSPFDTSIVCPGAPDGLQTYNTLADGENLTNGVEVLYPGEYQNPVQITTSTKFGDCSAFANEPAYPGIYRFDKGLWIDPAAGTSVTGSNIVIGTQAPYPLAGNVPGSGTVGNFNPSGKAGNGAPCLPTGTTASAASGGQSEVDNTHGCGGTTDFGVIAYGDSTFSPDPNNYGTGDNFSLIVGGAAGATVTLSGPTFGGYGGGGSPGLVLYQDSGTEANYGFNAESNDAATINVTGVVYDASIKSYGANAPLDYWDGTGGGIPFYAGGTLQTGYGAGWTGGPAASAGSVTITGTSIVDDFNTDGGTTITIVGQPYSLPGSGSLSLVG